MRKRVRLLLRGWEGVRLSSSNRSDRRRGVGIQGHWKMGVDVGMGFMGGDKGGLAIIVVIVGGPRPLLCALWGRLSNKSRLLAGDST